MFRAEDAKAVVACALRVDGIVEQKDGARITVAAVEFEWQARVAGLAYPRAREVDAVAQAVHRAAHDGRQ